MPTSWARATDSRVVLSAGTKFFPNGDLYQGLWREGLPHGPGQYKVCRAPVPWEVSPASSLITLPTSARVCDPVGQRQRVQRRMAGRQDERARHFQVGVWGAL